jgi:hypothetical protein
VVERTGKPAAAVAGTECFPTWTTIETTWLNGNTLFRVRPLPQSLPCEPGGPLC